MRGRDLVLAIFLALALRWSAVGHGLPHYAYVPDNHVVKAALGMARDLDLTAPSGTYTSYPYLMPYLLLPVYGTWYGAGRMGGDWSSTAEFGERLLDDPSHAYYLARWLVVGFALLLVAGIGRLTAHVGSKRAAGLAACLAATALMPWQLSLQARPWVPLTALGIWALERALQARTSGRTRTWCVAGALAGLSAACHQAGLLFGPLVGLVWLMPAGERAARRSVAGAVASLSGFVAAAVALGYPFWLVHGSLSGGGPGEATSLAVGGQGVRWQFGGARAGVILKSMFGYDPVVMLLGLGGVVLSRREKKGREVRGILAACAALWTGLFLAYSGAHVRYLLPGLMLLVPLAGVAGARWADRAGPRGRRLLALVLLVPILQGARAVNVMSRSDSRTEAADWITGELRFVNPDALVAVEGGEFPLLASAESLQRQIDDGLTLSMREARRLAQGTEGLNLLPLEKYFFDASGGSRTDYDSLTEGVALPPGAPGESLIERFMRAKRPTLVVLVDDTPVGPRQDPMARWLRSPNPTGLPWGRLLRSWRVTEAWLGEAHLPRDMEFPLTALWGTARPGPLVELWATGL